MDEVHSRTGHEGARWVWVFNATPRPGRFIPGKETRYQLYRRLGGSQGRSGRKLWPPTGIRSLDLPARSEPLSRPVMLMLNVFISSAFPNKW